MTDLLEYARFHYFSEWVALFVVIFTVFVTNKLFRLNYFNALLSAQVILIFNAIPIIAGFVDGYLNTALVAHFMVTESLLMIATCATYSFIVRKVSDRHEVIIDFFSGNIPYILIAALSVLAVFTYVVTPQDGTSRILYQTNYWYSLVKPVGMILGPVSYFAAFVVLMAHNRRIPAYGLLVVCVLGNIASGSKGAFVIQTLSAFLMVRDLGFASHFRLRRADITLATAGLFSGAALSLQRLEVSGSDIWDRIMLFGEPTLLTYFAPDPTAACNSLSLLAKMHRGWARLLGDPSALNIDTLFGYAWTIQYLGVNTFTGPNARYSAYLICNFPETDIVFGFVMTALYFGLLLLAVKLSIQQRFMLPVVYAYALSSMAWVAQDFNLLMQDINYFFAIIVVLVIFSRKKRDDRLSANNMDTVR